MNVLSVVCPKCNAASTGRCLEKHVWGSKYIETPHAERVVLFELMNNSAAGGVGE